MRYEIRPLGAWLGPKTPERASSRRFRAKWQSTEELLAAETEHLDAGVVVLQVDVVEGDLRRDGMLRVGARHAGGPWASRAALLTADTDTISRAYRRAAQRLHPDRGGDPAEWARLNEARDVLYLARRTG